MPRSARNDATQPQDCPLDKKQKRPRRHFGIVRLRVKNGLHATVSMSLDTVEVREYHKRRVHSVPLEKVAMFVMTNSTLK